MKIACERDGGRKIKQTEDYDFCRMGPMYMCGMSVPPFMMQRVADQIARQLFGVNQ